MNNNEKRRNSVGTITSEDTIDTQLHRSHSVNKRSKKTGKFASLILVIKRKFSWQSDSSIIVSTSDTKLVSYSTKNGKKNS